MYICTKCSKPMTCARIGVDVRFEPSGDVYGSDVWECKDCGTEFVVTGPAPAVPYYANSPDLKPYITVVDNLLIEIGNTQKK